MTLTAQGPIHIQPHRDRTKATLYLANVIRRTMPESTSGDNSAMRTSDQDDSTYFRSRDRVFCQNGKWFFQTREDDHGPYPTREAAALNLQRYVEEMAFFNGAKKPDATGNATNSNSNPEFANFSLVDKD